MPRKKKPDTRPLVDEFIEVKLAKNAAEKRYIELRAQILALGLTIVDGTNQKVVIVERSRTVLDTSTLKVEYGNEWYDGYCNSAQYYELEVINT